MYVPIFNVIEDRKAIFDFIQKNSFAILVSLNNTETIATHTPILLDEQASPGGQLFGHMARANEQWKSLSGNGLAIFHGAHAYISPTWYGEPENVPTWNYQAVHVYGKVTVTHDRTELARILERTVEFYEASRPNPWNLSKLSPALAEKLLGAIVGFRIEIERIEGKSKLSQNKSRAARSGVVAALKDSTEQYDREIAKLMEESLPRFEKMPND